MCGLCGILYKDGERQPDPALLKRMTDVIAHRGPDDEGWHFDGPCALGSRRLSIVGLGNGHMPMSTEDGLLWVAYNGEIYNHPDLRPRLEGLGHRYRTDSDTETLLFAYREWGEAFLERIHGMFAFALWDARQRKLILARDRIGIKPLYIQEDARAIRFGSEIKSILCDAEVERELDLQGLQFYLAYLASSAPHSLLKGVRKLAPGEMAVWSGGRLNYRQYWPAEGWRPEAAEGSTRDQVEEVRRRLDQAVNSHLMADVPVGAFLSGGIDSSVLALLMRDRLGPDFKTFSIGFEGADLFDESGDARRFAKSLGTEHHERKIKPNDLLSAVDDITWQLDEPLADSSCLPVYFVSQLARSNNAKVVLSGDGGDEIFAGYRKYQGEYYRRYFEWMPAPLQRALAAGAQAALPESRANWLMDRLRIVKKFFRGLDPDPFARHLGWAAHFDDAMRAALMKTEAAQGLDMDAPRSHRRALFDALPGSGDLTRMLWVDLRHNLPDDMLAKVDRMSMLHSIEVRVPFLDHTLVEYAFSLPDEVKLRGKTTKWILKEAFRDRLPGDLLTRPKHGFDVPVGEWFRHELRDALEDACSSERLNQRGLFDEKTVRAIINDHLDGRRDYNNQLWILLSLERWQRQFLDVQPGTIAHRPASAESP